MPKPANRSRIAGAATAAVGLGLAAGGLHYAALWPSSRIFGESLIASSDPAEVALTYDDGPNGDCTTQLLGLLARHRAPATFFVIGKYVRGQAPLVRAVRAAGHTIGCHTMTHPRLMYLRPAQIRQEIADAKAAIEDILGERIRYFRPPFGGRSPAVFSVLRELELTSVLWNVNPRDWRARSAPQIEQQLVRGIRRNQRRRHGSNLLMHDGGHVEMGIDRSLTLSATASLLSTAAQLGLRFVTPESWTTARESESRNESSFTESS